MTMHDDPLVALAVLAVVVLSAAASIWWAWRVVDFMAQMERTAKRQRDLLEAIDAKLAAIGNLTTKQAAALEKLAGE